MGVTREQVWQIPRRWCWTHEAPVWESDQHYGRIGRPCHVSGVLQEIKDEEVTDDDET